MTKEKKEPPKAAVVLESRDAAAVFGMDPGKSAFTLWAEKSGLVAPRQAGEAERFSRDSRDYIARRFSQMTGKGVRRVDSTIYNPAYPYARTELHHLVLGEGAGLTCESAVSLHLGRFGGRQYPREFYYPCLHRMLVTGRKKWYLAVQIPQKDLRIFELHADGDELQCLARGEEQFCRRVAEHCPPLPDGSASTLRTLELLHPLGRGSSLDLSPISLQLHDYLRWAQREQEAKDAMAARAATIEAFLGEHREGRLGKIRVRWSPVCRLSLDVDALRRDHPEVDFDRYRLTSQGRTLRVYREGEDIGQEVEG